MYLQHFRCNSSCVLPNLLLPAQLQLVFRNVPIDRPQMIISQYSVINDWLVVSKKANQEDQSNAAKPDELLFIPLSILSRSCFHFKGSNSATLSVSDTNVGGCIKNVFTIFNNGFDCIKALSGAVTKAGRVVWRWRLT